MALWGKTDRVADRPNWINLDNFPAGTSLVFVDAGEATVASNIAKGLVSPGWWLYNEYTDAQGGTRHKAELLVAIADNAATIAAGDDPAADDDAVVEDVTP